MAHAGEEGRWAGREGDVRAPDECRVAENVFGDGQATAMHKLHELCEVEKHEPDVLIGRLLIAQGLLDARREVVLLVCAEPVPARYEARVEKLPRYRRQKLGKQTVWQVGVRQVKQSVWCGVRFTLAQTR